MSPAEHPGDLLSAYLDGELDVPGAREVEAHLVHCCACNADLDDLSAARRRLRGLPPVPAPPGFVSAAVRRRRRAGRLAAAVAVAAAAVAVVTGLALGGEPAGRTDGPPALSLAGDPPRLGSAVAPGPLSGAGSEGAGSEIPHPLVAGEGGDGVEETGSGATATPAPGAASPGNGTGPEEASSPVTVGDRFDDLATILLELIGG